jgi:hypothetical protein
MMALAVPVLVMAAFSQHAAKPRKPARPPQNALFQSNVAEGMAAIFGPDGRIERNVKTAVVSDKASGKRLRLRDQAAGTAYVYLPVRIRPGSVPTHMQLWSSGSNDDWAESVLVLVSSQGSARIVSEVGPICHPNSETQLSEQKIDPPLDPKELSDASLFMGVALMRRGRPTGIDKNVAPKPLEASYVSLSDVCICPPSPPPCPNPKPPNLFEMQPK